MVIRERLAEHFPAFALEVRTPRLTLRFPDDADLLDLAEVGASGVHPPDEMPFETRWTEVPPPFQQRNTLGFFWTQRTTLQTDAPHLTLVAVVDGAVVGTQAMLTSSWSGTRTFETGSWLGLDHQGKGLGKEMRIAALQLAFDGFGAQRCTTAAHDDNAASIGVTRALGYRPNGNELVASPEGPRVLENFVMERSDFDAIRRDDIELVGAAAVLELFGTERPPVGPNSGS